MALTSSSCLLFELCADGTAGRRAAMRAQHAAAAGSDQQVRFRYQAGWLTCTVALVNFARKYFYFIFRSENGSKRRASQVFKIYH